MFISFSKNEKCDTFELDIVHVQTIKTLKKLERMTQFGIIDVFIVQLY